MNNPTFPTCPIQNCPGTFRRSYEVAKNVYYKCDVCGELSAARKATAAEKARKKAEKKNKPKTKKQLLEEYRIERERLNNLPQLPVEGWSPNEWFPGYEEEPCQMRFHI